MQEQFESGNVSAGIDQPILGDAGLTIQILQIDEVLRRGRVAGNFQDNIRRTLELDAIVCTVLNFAHTTASKLAKDTKKPSGMHVNPTVGMLSNMPCTA
jgi:hypothetical protein